VIESIIKKDIMAHALADSPRECCGLVIVYKGKPKYIPCINNAGHNDHFVINAKDYADAEDLGPITHIVHSHPSSLPTPSQTDLVSIELTGLPWIIVNPYIDQYTTTYPSGYVPPLVGREFQHGVIDCYTLVRDYYKAKLNITLGEYTRPDQWWADTELNFYDDYADTEGFVQVIDTPKEHDLIIMRIASSKNNHAAIYIGNNKILHHPMNRLSGEDVYGGWWQKITSKILRHKTLI
jgi:proteasome lid subunit RPN8/RPN11